MSTIRVAKRDRWTAIDRRTINDKRLSFRARGVLAWLLDKPDDWVCRARDVADAGAEGRDAVRVAMRELEELGYLRREHHRGADGRFRTFTTVYESPPGPENPSRSDQGKHAKPQVAPGPGKPAPVSQALFTKTENEDTDSADKPRRRPRDPLWDALVNAFGDARTQSERAFYGSVVKELREVGATAEEVAQRVAEARRRGWQKFTPRAIVQHWSALAAATVDEQLRTEEEAEWERTRQLPDLTPPPSKWST